MAEEPNHLVIRILREIQTTLADHGRLHEEHRRNFKHIEVQLTEMSDSMMSALGLAAHSNVPHENVQRQIQELNEKFDRLDSELRNRVARLEERV